MKSIHDKFTDEEHAQLTEAKQRSGARNWHDFIMLLVEYTKKKR
jgi:hypothetical protein